MRISDWSSDVCSSDLCGEFFHGLHERQSALIGHPPNRVSVRSAAEAVIKALFVVDGEAGRFLIMKGATRLVLAPGLLDFDRLADLRRKRDPCAAFIQPLRGQGHRYHPCLGGGGSEGDRKSAV